MDYLTFNQAKFELKVLSFPKMEQSSSNRAIKQRLF